MNQEKIKELVAQMTLEEKAGLCSGGDFWHTKAVERLGIPSMTLSDGPFGLRKQEENGDHLGLNDSILAVSFPAGVNVASSFDKELTYKLGEILGEECQAENVSVLLGPAMNIKRSPLCGRNFEYYSEDPYLSSQIAAAYINGVQSKHVGACPKHFYANNMENYRMTTSSEMDERTQREIYLASFATAVREAKPWSIMCSYNMIGGIYAAENKEALTDILREEWGFDGFVVSDWGAVNDRVPDLAAGLDLEMPSSNGVNDRKIVDAVQSGKIPEACVDEACTRILSILYRFIENQDKSAVFNLEGDHEKARAIASETMVLLKNDGILPLKPEQKVAFIGQYAAQPRYQGGGSSHINSFKAESAIDMVPKDYPVVYAKGFRDETDETDNLLLQEAVEVAKSVDTVVLFVGLPERYESEGYDREHMQIPPNQLELIEEICKVQSKTAVVLHNGAPIEMPFVNKVGAILESYLGGQAVGGAQVDLLYGNVNPSAKLAETFPIKLSDNPSYLNFKIENGKVNYAEGIFVGYRYYDKKQCEVLFPFGHGLSYTNFTYSNLTLDHLEMKDTDTLKISVDITNSGDVFGKEIVQLYVMPEEGSIVRPVRELKAFEKIGLMPGETKNVTFILDSSAFAYWDVISHNWFVESGEYGIAVGASSSDIRLCNMVKIQGTTQKKVVYTRDTAIGEIMRNPEKIDLIQQVMNTKGGGELAQENNEVMPAQAIQAMMMSMPLRLLVNFGMAKDEMIDQLIDLLNQ